MTSMALLLAHDGHWTTGLLYAIPAVAIGVSLWASARSTGLGDEERRRDDPRLSEDA